MPTAPKRKSRTPPKLAEFWSEVVLTVPPGVTFSSVSTHAPDHDDDMLDLLEPPEEDLALPAPKRPKLDLDHLLPLDTSLAPHYAPQFVPPSTAYAEMQCEATLYTESLPVSALAPPIFAVPCPDGDQQTFAYSVLSLNASISFEAPHPLSIPSNDLYLPACNVLPCPLSPPGYGTSASIPSSPDSYTDDYSAVDEFFGEMYSSDSYSE